MDTRRSEPRKLKRVVNRHGSVASMRDLFQRSVKLGHKRLAAALPSGRANGNPGTVRAAGILPRRCRPDAARRARTYRGAHPARRRAVTPGPALRERGSLPCGCAPGRALAPGHRKRARWALSRMGWRYRIHAHQRRGMAAIRLPCAHAACMLPGDSHMGLRHQVLAGGRRRRRITAGTAPVVALPKWLARSRPVKFYDKQPQGTSGGVRVWIAICKNRASARRWNMTWSSSAAVLRACRRPFT